MMHSTVTVTVTVTGMGVATVTVTVAVKVTVLVLATVLATFQKHPSKNRHGPRIVILYSTMQPPQLWFR